VAASNAVPSYQRQIVFLLVMWFSWMNNGNAHFTHTALGHRRRLGNETNGWGLDRHLDARLGSIGHTGVAPH
jgi:hypothetical protein